MVLSKVLTFALGTLHALWSHVTVCIHNPACAGLAEKVSPDNVIVLVSRYGQTATEAPDHSGQEAAQAAGHPPAACTSVLRPSSLEEGTCDEELLLPNQVHSPGMKRERALLAVEQSEDIAQACEEHECETASTRVRDSIKSLQITSAATASPGIMRRARDHYGTERWLPYWRDGKLILVSGLRPPPEVLLKEIARHTPMSPSSIIRQPAHPDNRMTLPEPTANDVCTRAHPVQTQAIKAGLLGSYFFDPRAWQCCNSARAEGWESYDLHACPACRRRSA